jgi:hypothetical protein
MPEFAQVSAGRRAGTVMYEVDLVPRHDVSFQIFSSYGANAPIFV